jgi:ribosomal protein L37AE/L43A
MTRKMRVHPCPVCDRNRVHNASTGRWECPDCEWPRHVAEARERAVAEARARHYAR